MDRLFEELYSGDPHTIEWAGTDTDEPLPETLSAIRNVIDGASTDTPADSSREVAQVTACPAGAQVCVDGYVDDEESVVLVASAFEGGLMNIGLVQLKTQVVLIKPTGQVPVCRLESAMFSPSRAGIGVRFIATLVQRLERAGFAWLTLEAAGTPRSAYNGYYSWAAMGFNIILPEDLATRAAKDRFPATSTHELIDRYQEDGLRWWMENGRTAEAAFQLSPDSRHEAILQAYLKRKGIGLR